MVHSSTSATDCWDLSRFADSASSAFFLIRHEGKNDANLALLSDALLLCDALSHGYEIYRCKQTPKSSADLHIAESLHKLLNNKDFPPISATFAGLLKKLDWAKQMIQKVHGSTKPTEEDLLAAETYFSKFSLLLSRQMLWDYEESEHKRTRSITVEPLRDSEW